jgi:hypothetical protein
MAYNDCSTSEKERSDASDGNNEDGSRADRTARSPGVDLPSRLLLIAFEPVPVGEVKPFLRNPQETFNARSAIHSHPNTGVQVVKRAAAVLHAPRSTNQQQVSAASAASIQNLCFICFSSLLWPDGTSWPMH